MRTIPSELLNRVRKKWQVPVENADPKMKVYLSRGLQNELFQVFTIQEGELLTDVDVTVSRPNAITLPATAYALAINNGLAQVKSKPLPYDDQYPWEDEFNVATGVTSVAIEFDGYWDRDYNTGRFNFVTEEHPWLFYVQAGNLYMQYWQDSEELLATNVTKCAAVRGWVPANGQTANDQGLIVAYIKTDGKVYYRSYCATPTGKAWESEREVTELGSGVDDLALFRTNDFRVGFLAESGGNVSWVLTARNWAGMSVASDRIALSEVKPVLGMVDIFEITTHGYNAPEETIMPGISNNVAVANLFETEPPATIYGVSSAKVVDANAVDVTFDCPVVFWNEDFMLLSMTTPSGTVTNATIRPDGRTIRYTIEPPLDNASQAAGIPVTMRANVLLLHVNANRNEFFSGANVQALGILPPQTITLGFGSISSSGTVTMFEITTTAYGARPHPTINISNIGFATGSVELTDTGYIPV